MLQEVSLKVSLKPLRLWFYESTHAGITLFTLLRAPPEHSFMRISDTSEPTSQAGPPGRRVQPCAEGGCPNLLRWARWRGPFLWDGQEELSLHLGGVCFANAWGAIIMLTRVETYHGSRGVQARSTHSSCGPRSGVLNTLSSSSLSHAGCQGARRV